MNNNNVIKPIGESPSTTVRIIRESLQNEYNLDNERLNKALEKTNGMIAGSFVLHCELKRLNVPLSWNCNDVDIWVESKNKKYFNPVQKFHKLFVESGYKLLHTYIPGNNDSNIAPYDSYERLQSFVRHIVTYQHQTTAKKIQLVVIKEFRVLGDSTRSKNSAIDTVVSFDLNICQFVYNGMNAFNLSDLERNSSGQLLMKLTPASMNQSTYEWFRTFSRVEKYQRRGFVLVDSVAKLLKHIIQQYYEKTLQHLRQNVANLLVVIQDHIQDSIENTYVPNMVKLIKSFNEHSLVENSNVDIQYNLETNQVEIKNRQQQEFYTIPCRFMFDLESSIDEAKRPDDLQQAINQYSERAQVGQFNTPALLSQPMSVKRKSERQVEEKLQPLECFNFIEYDNEQIENYVNKDDDNLVIIHSDGRQAVCSHKQWLRDTLQDYSSVYFPCVGMGGHFPIATNIQFVKISMKEFQVFVPLKDIQAVIDDNDYCLFELIETGIVINTTASAEAIIANNYQSADHCQSGTSKRIHRLRPLEITETDQV